MDTIESTLPQHRVLKRSKLDPYGQDPAEYFPVAASPDATPNERLTLEMEAEERCEAIGRAICAGQQLKCRSNQADTGLREACMTMFLDPETGEQRFAVEVWYGSDTGTHDFSTLSAAEDRLGHYFTQLMRYGKLPLRAV
jgi:hypothetical protein